VLQLKIVQDGTFEMTLGKGVIENRPTCSFIESKRWDSLKNWNTLIDLDHPINDSSDLVNALAALGVTPQQIKVIILTHLHPDHIGHKNLFPNAIFMYHKDESLSFYFKNNQTIELAGDVIYELSNDSRPQHVDYVPDIRRLGNRIYIHHCPGHTKGSLAIFACIDGLVHAFVGGIFLNREYYDRWQAPGMSWEPERIYEHMAFIKENADVIVPGHGAPFII